MTNPQYDAIIIGAGHNGLVTSYYLAKQGLSVLVLERLERLGGGSVSEDIYPGFVAPYCAYMCYMLQGRVIDDMQLRDHGFEIIPWRYGHFHPYPDGSYLLAHGDEADTAREIAKFSEKDAMSYPDWLSFWKRAAGILHRHWLKDPPTMAQIFEEVRGTSDEHIWETMLTTSMRELVEDHFESDPVRAHFMDADETGNPDAPGSVLSYAYYRCFLFSKPENVGVPRGGMSQIPESMARSAREMGVEVRMETRVEKVLVKDGKAVGVRLSNGQEIKSKIVVSNADPKRTYTKLVDPGLLDESFVKKVKELKTESRYVKFLAALREAPDFSRYLGAGYDIGLTPQVRICPSLDYFMQSWSDCQNNVITECPVMDIQIPSIVDPSLAPAGHHVLSAWVVYYPSEPENTAWDVQRDRVGNQIIDVLTEYAPNFRDSIIDWLLLTTQDIEEREFMTDGSIRHLELTVDQVNSGRMPYRSPIDGLYLCGAGTHPGGEITGAPGFNAARTILSDLKSGGARRVFNNSTE